MEFDRNKSQGGADEARKRLKFCLDQLEKAPAFRLGLNLETVLFGKCTLEELIGALVSAEQVITEFEEY
jgi:hypothetical protein